MNRYQVESASYHKLLDILYVGYGDSGLDVCHHVEDTPSGIIVMYDQDGSFAGAEIPRFSQWRDHLPAIIGIDAQNPFELAIDSVSTFPA